MWSDKIQWYMIYCISCGFFHTSVILHEAKISAFWFIANPPLNADMISGGDPNVVFPGPIHWRVFYGGSWWLNWILRGIIAQLTSIYFLSRFGQTARPSNLNHRFEETPFFGTIGLLCPPLDESTFCVSLRFQRCFEKRGHTFCFILYLLLLPSIIVTMAMSLHSMLLNSVISFWGALNRWNWDLAFHIWHRCFQEPPDLQLDWDRGDWVLLWQRSEIAPSN